MVLKGSGRIKIEDEIVELEQWDAIAVPGDKMRCIESGRTVPRSSRAAARPVRTRARWCPAGGATDHVALHFLKCWSRAWTTGPAGASTRTSSRRSATRRSSSSAALAQARRPHLREARGLQPDRLGQGPRGALDDRGRRGAGRDRARPDDPRADLGQHRHLAGDDLLAQGLPAQGRDARQRDRGAHPAPAHVRRGDRLLARRAGLQRRRGDGARDGRGRLVATTCPTSTGTRPTRTPTTTARRSRSSRSSTRWPRSWRASAPAAR